MHKENSVYDYIINSINNIITNGISYYVDKDIDKINRLMDIYDYINGDVESVIAIDNDSDETEFVEDKIVECTQLDNIIKVNDEVAKKIKILTDDFMSKMTDIKINILNLENDLSLYYDSKPDDIVEDMNISSVVSDDNIYTAPDNSLTESGEEIKLGDEVLRVNTVKVKDLNIDNDSIEISDSLDIDETIVEENEESVVEDDAITSSTENNDLYSEDLLLESESTEKIEDENKSTSDEDEVLHSVESIDDTELNAKPKKHSILDLFRKKNG